MYKVILMLTVSGVVCLADPVPAHVQCGAYPNEIFKCIGNPLNANPTIEECVNLSTQCERNKCVFRKMGWMKDDVIDKSKVAAFYDKFAKDYPVWADAVAAMKTTCLAGDLPSQGAEANCPAYDIKLCLLRTIFKHVKPSQWSSSSECVAPRQYVESCPICPQGCEDRSKIAQGLCNACKA